MAISDLLPRKTMRNLTLRQSLQERLDYDLSIEKTADGAYVRSYMCQPETAAEEFEISKQIYEATTGRSQPKSRDIIMYRIIQSFKPGEITPEEANKIGYELAKKFTRGKHQFVVSTHIDKCHIHNHIEFNSTNLECDGKFNNFKDSSFALRTLNDKICREHGLSVIENPKKRNQRFAENAAAKRGRSFKEQLRQTIEKVLPDSKDFEDFLTRMRSEGYEVKQNKRISFRCPGQERFTRSDRLGDKYSEEAIRDRIIPSNKQTRTGRKQHPATKKKINLLIDIQAKMQSGKGKGYEYWAKIFNLKEAAKTLNFLVDNGLTDYEQLEMRREESGKKFDTLSLHIKQLEARMMQISQLKTQIFNYSKTRDVYVAYKKSRYNNRFRADHAEEIAKHEAAKAAFDALEGKNIPKIAQLSEQYAVLLSEKEATYTAYKAARKEMIELQTMKQNVDRILNLTIDEPTHDRFKEVKY